MSRLRVGCSGWDYDDWDGVVFPDGVPKKRRLECYAELFDTVEVNSSFYSLPKASTVESWVERTPEEFIFAFKASRYLTHVKRLKAIGNGIRRLRSRLRPAAERGKLGPILWQLPPNFHRDDDRLAGVLDLLGEGRHAFEFRHQSWFCEPVYERLREAGAALVIADHPERAWSAHEITADWTYVRLHYGSRGRRGNYSGSELATWKRRLAAWRRERDVYAYLNNDWEGFAPRNAIELLPKEERPKL